MKQQAHLVPTFAVLLLAIALLPLTGCGGAASRSVSVNAWQENVEHYVKDQGQGDPTVLRDVTLGDGRKGYAMLGNPVVADATDAVGLLVGVPRIGGQAAFVFLLGINDKGKVADVRLVALSFQDGKLHWYVGTPNPAALQTYLKYRDEAWHADAPGRKDTPMLAENFPARDDVFNLSVEPGRLSAVHQASKATWTVPLTGSRQ